MTNITKSVFVPTLVICLTVIHQVTCLSSVTITVLNTRTNATLVNVQGHSSWASFNANNCFSKKYLFVTKPEDGCEEAQSPPADFSNYEYNARETKHQERCWICLIKDSENCDLDTKLRNAYKAGCRYLLIELPTSQVPHTKHRTTEHPKINFTFISNEGGIALRKYAFPKRFLVKISTSNSTNGESTFYSWKWIPILKSIGCIVSFFTIYINRSYLRLIIGGLRMALWPIFVLVTIILLICGKTTVVLHGNYDGPLLPGY